MISKNERNLLEFIPQFQREHRHNPSVADISVGISKSNCWVRYTLRKFKTKKYLTYNGSVQHTLKVLKTPAMLFELDEWQKMNLML